MKTPDFRKSPISLKKGAIFVADVHYQKGVREGFVPFLHYLMHYPPPQLFLMGDIFDLLVGNIDTTLHQNKRVIDLLQELSQKSEVIYLEGNHDFHLQSIFTKMRVVPRSKQPLVVDEEGKKIALLHGDLFTTLSYEIYIRSIQNPLFLAFLRFFDSFFDIAGKIQHYNASKDLCHKEVDLDRRREQLLKKLSVNMVVEGHYHQGLITSTYINLPSFACNGEYLLLGKYGWEKMEFVE